LTGFFLRLQFPQKERISSKLTRIRRKPIISCVTVDRTPVDDSSLAQGSDAFLHSVGQNFLNNFQRLFVYEYSIRIFNNNNLHKVRNTQTGQNIVLLTKLFNNFHRALRDKILLQIS